MPFLRKQALAAVLTAVFLLVGGRAAAQFSDSGHSFGLRLGNEISADYNYQFTTHSALDVKAGVVNPYTKSYQFALLSAAYHCCFGAGSRVFPYFGVGFSTGMQFGHWKERESSKITYFLSADIPLGIEYRLLNKPVVFSLEWSPKYQFLSYRHFAAHSVSIGVRYVFPKYASFRK